jgi:hypothetical protein
MTWVIRIAIALLSAAPAAAIIYALFYVQDLNRLETPGRISACNSKNGTAKLDRGGNYVGCMIPPPGARSRVNLPETKDGLGPDRLDEDLPRGR